MSSIPAGSMINEPQRASRAQRIDAIWGYLFIAAPLLGFLIFALGPLVASIALSFMRWDLVNPPKWIGLDNWVRAFTKEPLIWTSLQNSAFLLLGIPISLLLALLLASLMNRPMRGVSGFRVLYYLPTILPLAAVSLLWMWVLNPDYGLLNQGLRAIGLPNSLSRWNWLQDKDLVKPALIIMAIWRGVGYQALVYLAGLQGVSKLLYEAAEIDGANGWQKFWAVTWPSISPTTFFLVVTSLIGGFQVFVEPQIMTQGGPQNASLTMVMLIWREAFRDWSMGYASSMAWMLGIIIMVITIINFLLAKKWVFYEN